MKIFSSQVLIYLVLSAFLISCTNDSTTSKETVEEINSSAEQFPEMAKNMTIYEVNIRQYTAEGTLNAFSGHLPNLKDLGVEILWIMPIQPIGEKNRKGGLGSYYSIKNYRDVNPEFGTLSDFKTMVEKAHQLGLYVILDWVPNHTAWDHPWITEHPEYYARDKEGNITYEADWTDIALLDHTNPDTRKSMIEDMKFWIRDMDIDGFRCDHAGHEIPITFWEEAIPEMNQMKNLFWLAEWDDPVLHSQFDATYNWELHHITNRVAKGENTVGDLIDYVNHDLERYGKEAYRLNFITNHDENAWNGTVFERYGDGHKANAVFMWTITGMPMIYSGQEAGMSKRLRFFEKDTIDWSDPLKMRTFYTSLDELRKKNEALWSGKYGGEIKFIDTGNDYVIAYSREKNGNLVSTVINLSGEEQSIELPKSTVVAGTDYFTQTAMNLSVESLKLGPWKYYVLIK